MDGEVLAVIKTTTEIIVYILRYDSNGKAYVGELKTTFPEGAVVLK